MENSIVKNYYKDKQDFTVKCDYHNHMNEEAKNFARNLRILMQHHGDNQVTLAKKSGVSQKTISNMLNSDDQKSFNLKNVSLIAKTYKLQTWHLLYPNAPEDILINTSIEKFVDNYVHADKKVREAWAHVAEVSADYEKTKTG